MTITSDKLRELGAHLTNVSYWCEQNNEQGLGVIIDLQARQLGFEWNSYESRWVYVGRKE